MSMSCGLRLQQRLQLQQRLVQRLGFSKEEQEYYQQFEALEKMKEDLEGGIYSTVPEFSERLMKRIKTEKRTKPVQDLVQSLRDLIAGQESRLNLGLIQGLVELGITETKNMSYADDLIDSFSKLAGRVDRPLEQLVAFGRDLRDEHYPAQSAYNHVLALEKKTAGAFSAQESFDALTGLLAEYAQDRKIIAHCLQDITESRGLVREEKLDREKAELFFRLLRETCELAIPTDSAYEKMNLLPLLYHENSTELFRQYAKIPSPILAELVAQHAPETALEKMNQFAGTKDMRNSRDNKRAYLSAMIMIRQRLTGGEVADILQKSNSMRQARDILAKLAGLCRINIAHYSFNLPDGQAILDYLDRKKEFTNPVLNQLSGDGQRQFCDLIYRNLPSRYDFMPLLKLGEIYQGEYEHGIALLGRVMESMIFNRFEEFRYTGEEAEAQLKCLQGQTKQWRENHTQRRLMGNLQGAEPALKAAQKIIKQMEEKYGQVYESAPNLEYLCQLTEQKTFLVNQMSNLQKEQKEVPRELLNEVDALNERLRYGYLLTQLHDLSSEQLSEMGKTLSRTLVIYDNPHFQAEVQDLVRIVNSPEVQAIKVVAIRDTDDPNYLFDVGCTPKQSCQRWTEKTGQNYCLPAYVSDANKRLVQALDERSRVRVRSIYRLMEVEELPDMPTIFIEEPYEDIVSDDLYRALLTRMVEKAYAMSEETALPIAVAAHNDDYKRLLEEIAGQLKIKYKTRTFTTTFPASRNGREYSDGFGGGPHGSIVFSGQKYSCENVGYVVIEAED